MCIPDDDNFRTMLKTSCQASRFQGLQLVSQVEALLDRAHGEAPVMDFVARSLEELGFASWAQRVVHSGGARHDRHFIFHLHPKCLSRVRHVDLYFPTGIEDNFALAARSRSFSTHYAVHCLDFNRLRKHNRC